MQTEKYTPGSAGGGYRSRQKEDGGRAEYRTGKYTHQNKNKNKKEENKRETEDRIKRYRERHTYNNRAIQTDTDK